MTHKATKLPTTFHNVNDASGQWLLEHVYMEARFAPSRAESIEGRYQQVSGGQWFDEGTMKYFGTKLQHYAYRHVASGRVVFLTRDYTGPRSKRRAYSVRAFDWLTGSIDTIGDLGSLTAKQAEKLAVRYLLTGEGSTLKSACSTPCAYAEPFEVNVYASDVATTPTRTEIQLVSYSPACDPVSYENPQRAYCDGE